MAADWYRMQIKIDVHILKNEKVKSVKIRVYY
ncbi:hypothetical protein BLAT2472_30056 [Burkholderia latens]